MKILSVRGDKLTVLLSGKRKSAARYGKHVWVVRAGSQPRAWCKRDTPKGGKPAAWREARFPCDGLLIHPDARPRNSVASVRSLLRTWSAVARPQAATPPWSAVAEHSADTALDSSGVDQNSRDQAFIQSGVALTLPTAVHGAPQEFALATAADPFPIPDHDFSAHGDKLGSTLYLTSLKGGIVSGH